jgi:hypothetical protein
MVKMEDVSGSVFAHGDLRIYQVRYTEGILWEPFWFIDETIPHRRRGVYCPVAE